MSKFRADEWVWLIGGCGPVLLDIATKKVDGIGLVGVLWWLGAFSVHFHRDFKEAKP